MGYDYDVLVIGSGPGGQKASIQAAKLGRRVGLIEKRREVGGVSVNTGTIASKTLREAVLHLTGTRHRGWYGDSYRVKGEITFDDLRAVSRHVIEREVDVVRDQLRRNHVQLIEGTGRFADPHHLVVSAAGTESRLSAEVVIVAAGTRPAHPAGVDFDSRTVIDSDGLLQLATIPQSIVIVGAGVIGVEYASMFAALGVKVALVETRDHFLEFCDGEIVEGLRFHLREHGVTLRLGETVAAVERHQGGTITHLASGKRIAAESVLYSAGRQGAVDELALDAVGLEATARGHLTVDERFHTGVAGIYAVGDIIGFPSLAATAMEQGRLAACHALGEPVEDMGDLVPFGIYSIPEISYVGRTEDELTTAGVPYETGISRYRELARGQILGDSWGLLKVIVSTEDRRVLGVHALGTSATEIIHTGQAVMAHGGTVDYLVNAVFNYPTLAESYKVAALDATNKMRAISRLDASAIEL